jgi:hypothetical protein
VEGLVVDLLECPRCRKRFEPGPGPGASCPGCGQAVARQATYVAPAAVTAMAPRRRGTMPVTGPRKKGDGPRRALRAVVAAGILLTAATGVAAFEFLRPAGASTETAAPLWKPGYRWAYEVAIGGRATAPDGRPLEPSLTGVARVSVVNPYPCVPWPCGYGVRSTLHVGKESQGEYATVDKDTLGWRETSTFSHPAIPFPLVAGKRGTIDGYTYDMTYQGQVPVQAGSFVAYRITYSDGEGSIAVVYAPAVRAPIRVESSAAGGGVEASYVAELSSFSL